MQYQPLLPDQYFHIYNRGNNGEDIFYENKNYHFFMELMKRHLIPVCDIISYCLMKNHFHLLIKTNNLTEKRLSQGFSNLFNPYAKAFNKANDRNGSLFQDRFKRNLIIDEKYLINCILYIHHNPENHNFVENFAHYPYSSYKELLAQRSELLEMDYVLTLFGGQDNFLRVHKERRINENELKY